MATKMENIGELVQQWVRDPEIARVALRQLIPLVVSKDESIREWASEAIENCGPPLESDMDWLVEQTASNEADVIYWACTLLGRLGEKATGHQFALVRVLTSPDRTSIAKRRAAWALVRTGPLTNESRQSLDSAALSPDVKLASLAKLALKEKP